MTKRALVQSFSINDEEQIIIATLAKSQGIKPATLTRGLFMRGLNGFLSDRKIRPEKFDEEIIDEASKLILTDKTLKRAKEIAEGELRSKTPASIERRYLGSKAKEGEVLLSIPSLIGKEVSPITEDAEEHSSELETTRREVRRSKTRKR